MTEVFMEFWDKWYPVVLLVGGGIITIGGVLLSAYIFVKPKIDWLKNKLVELKDNTTTDSVTQNITNKLKTTDLDVKIAELQDKINNPLTSEASRKIYTQSLQVYTEMKIKLENGIAITNKVEDVTNKFL